jgi:hypothetical protein
MKTEIEQEYDLQSRNQTTGRLYMPSQKWGGWAVMQTGARCSFGSTSMKTKESMMSQAVDDSINFKARIYCFKRGNPCSLVAIVDNGNIQEAPQ